VPPKLLDRDDVFRAAAESDKVGELSALLALVA